MKDKISFGSGMSGLIKRIRASNDLSWLCAETCLKNPKSLNNQINEKDINSLIRILKKYAAANVRVEGKGKNDLTGRKKFTIVKDNKERIWPWRWEEALERCIVKSKSDISNQLPVGKTSKESVDLYSIDPKTGEMTLIELKPWNSSNNLWHAVVEAMKNYYLYLRLEMAKGNPCKRLLILAPVEFYEKSLNKSKESYKELVKALSNSEFPIPIGFMGIDYSRNNFLEQCIKKLNVDGWQVAKRTTQYTKFQNIDAFSIEALKEEWVDILP